MQSAPSAYRQAMQWVVQPPGNAVSRHATAARLVRLAPYCSTCCVAAPNRLVPPPKPGVLAAPNRLAEEAPNAGADVAPNAGALDAPNLQRRRARSTYVSQEVYGAVHHVSAARYGLCIDGMTKAMCCCRSPEAWAGLRAKGRGGGGAKRGRAAGSKPKACRAGRPKGGGGRGPKRRRRGGAKCRGASGSKAAKRRGAGGAKGRGGGGAKGRRASGPKRRRCGQEGGMAAGAAG